MDKLKEIIEAIVFLSGDAVSISDIAQKLEISAKEVEKAAQELKEKYSGDSGVNLLIFNKKLQFSSNPDYAESVETVLNPIKERELSKTMMEVAAIIAYKQPVTRLEIEEVRGVNSDYAVLTLTKHNIIEVVGRKDAIGKPLLYGTTDEFLKRFQLSSISDLPDYDELLGRIKILHSDSSDLYYREQYNPDEDEQPQLVSTVAEEPELLMQLSELQRQNNISQAFGGTAAKAEMLASEEAKGGVANIDANLQTQSQGEIDTAMSEAAATLSDDSDDLPERTENYNAQDDISCDGGNAADDNMQEDLPDFLKDEKHLKIINS